MKTMEIIMLAAGVILFVFALIVMFVLLKNKRPFGKAIWLLLISFLMMGFSSIVEAEIFGLFTFRREKKLAEVELYAEKAELYPDNPEAKRELREKLNTFEKTEKVSEAKDKAVLGYAYYVLGDENKALQESNQALLEDSTNKQAKSVIDLINIKEQIKKLETSDNKLKLDREIQPKIESLKVNPRISTRQKENILSSYNKKRDSLKLNY